MNIYLSLIIDGGMAMAMTATKSADGVITPIAFESQPVNVRDNLNGIISINDDNQYAVNSLLRKILNKITGEYDIRGVYLGIMPRSLRGEVVEITREFSGRHRITEREIEALNREVDSKTNNAIIAKYDNGFIRDGVETLNVRNELADTLVRRSLVVVMNTRLAQNYQGLFSGNIRLFAAVPTQVAIAHVITDEKQRVDGALAFYIGNQSSGLTFIQNDLIMATAVVPFGFDHVLNDMAAGLIPVEKILSLVTGTKMMYKCSDDTFFRFGKEGDDFNFSQALEAFNARLREIFSLGYDRVLATLGLEELKVPVVVNSSILNTHDFVSALSDMLEQDCILGAASDVLNDDTFSSAKYIPLISIINEATENCIEERAIIVSEHEEDTGNSSEKEEKGKKEKNKKDGKKSEPRGNLWSRLGGASFFSDEQ